MTSTVEYVPVQDRDVNGLAELHQRAFPEFFLSSLGTPFLVQFYKGFVADPTAVTVVARRDGRVVGLVVGTTEPAGFFRRLLQRRLPGFVLASAQAAARQPTAIPRLVRGITYRGDTPSEAEGALLSSICVSPDEQGSGIGKELVRRWEAEVAARGVGLAYLTTDAVDNDATISFYERLGWIRDTEYATPEWRRMLRYRRELTPVTGRRPLRIRFFNAYFTPEAAASNYLGEQLCAHLADQGHQVSMVVPTPTRGVDPTVRAQYPAGHVERPRPGFSVRRVGLPPEGSNPVQRAARYALMQARFMAIGLRDPGDVNFLYSTPPTMGLMSGALERLTGVPAVYNVQDMFPDSLVGTGLATESSPVYRIGAALQRWTCRSNTRLVTISPAFERSLLGHGAPPGRVSVIRNWVDVDHMRPVPWEENAFVAQHGLSANTFHVIYSGNIGLTQNFEMLLDVASDLRDRSDIRFVIVGDGAFRETLAQQLSARRLDNVLLLPYQDVGLIPHVYSAAGAGLVISKPQVGANSVPSKTWAIMATARPVLASFDTVSELSKIIAESGAGVCCPAGDREALTTAIRHLADDPQTAEEMGRRGRMYAMTNLSRQAGTTAMEDILFAAVEEKRISNASRNRSTS